MSKILKWIKEHVRPYCKTTTVPDKILTSKDDLDKSEILDIDKLKNKTEVGIKFIFKF